MKSAEAVEKLEERVDRLERELVALRARRVRSVRWRADWGIGKLPMWEVAVGPDPARGESYGHARAVVALGDIATGFVAVGGWARGVIALGGLAAAVSSFSRSNKAKSRKSCLFLADFSLPEAPRSARFAPGACVMRLSVAATDSSRLGSSTERMSRVFWLS